MKFYKKPYPFNEDLKHNAKIIFFISIGILAVLLIFQPVELSDLNRKDIFYLTTGLAASTFLSLAINLIVIPSLFPKIFNQKRWTIVKEVFWNLWIVFTILMSHLLFYTKLFGYFEIDFGTVGKLLLLSVLPVSVLITINQDRLLKAHLKSAETMNKKLSDVKLSDEILVNFSSDYKGDSVALKISSLLLVRSANNYVEIFYRENDIIKSQMVRCSMIRAESAVKEFDFVMRCHRMYIINVNHINKIEGNSQGYKITQEGLSFPVFVSQKYISSFKKIVK